jgi:hypothetical protein
LKHNNAITITLLLIIRLCFVLIISRSQKIIKKSLSVNRSIIITLIDKKRRHHYYRSYRTQYTPIAASDISWIIYFLLSSTHCGTFAIAITILARDIISIVASVEVTSSSMETTSSRKKGRISSNAAARPSTLRATLSDSSDESDDDLGCFSLLYKGNRTDKTTKTTARNQGKAATTSTSTATEKSALAVPTKSKHSVNDTRKDEKENCRNSGESEQPDRRQNDPVWIEEQGE